MKQAGVEQLTAIAQRLAQATPGTWSVHTYHIGFPWESKKTVIVYKQKVLCHTNMKATDVVFIAQAPTDLAYLLERVKAAEAVYKEIQRATELLNPGMPSMKMREVWKILTDALTTWQQAKGER